MTIGRSGTLHFIFDEKQVYFSHQIIEVMATLSVHFEKNINYTSLIRLRLTD